MTPKQFDEFKAELEKRGYRFVSSNDRPHYYKVMEYRPDKYGDQRAVCQLIFYLYDFTDYGIDIEPYSYEPIIFVSRNSDERIDLNACHPKRSIDECERIAHEFMKFVDNNIPIEYDNSKQY